ncbi:polysaccharide export protein [Limibaculum sp. M0105]|uniref:Polysaccharide export protein n=1 Tax=Thermohalobaculum xanthum TaxID=2753746 RepID=A0A8J7M5L1_9RHOB|nr:polysaccharide biosynthesis/export family protein [Thermohalobaculum xanthum]MBK0398721.1 polysaccharide export protein [Thermohalobaculum xanthum]
MRDQHAATSAIRCLLIGVVVLLITAGQALAQSSGYELGRGDRLRINVFGEPDLSGEFEIDGSGALSLPLIGVVQGGGLTSRELESEIARRFSEGYLKNPQVSIEVLNYRPFYILGEVKTPGSYPYREGMTLLNAAALAGGFTYRADADDIRVKRDGREEAKMPPDTVVQPGDVIRVTERIF